jgi:hypothetical protein
MTPKRARASLSGGTSDNTHAPPGRAGTYWAAVVLAAAARRWEVRLLGRSQGAVPRGCEYMREMAGMIQLESCAGGQLTSLARLSITTFKP